MIKANELRIGNIVLHEGNPYKVMWRDLGFDNTHFEPIQLAPEILEKFTSVEPHLKLRPSAKDNSRYYLDIGFIRHIQYLHEYQNIYHALTGKELEITL